MIYRYEKPRRPGRPRKGKPKGRKTKVWKFLDNEVKRDGVRIRGPYYNEEVLMNHVMYDIAAQVANMVNESATIRKTINKALVVP